MNKFNKQKVNLHNIINKTYTTSTSFDCCLQSDFQNPTKHTNTWMRSNRNSNSNNKTKSTEQKHQNKSIQIIITNIKPTKSTKTLIGHRMILQYFK